MNASNECDDSEGEHPQDQNPSKASCLKPRPSLPPHESIDHSDLVQVSEGSHLLKRRKVENSASQEKTHVATSELDHPGEETSVNQFDASQHQSPSSPLGTGDQINHNRESPIDKKLDRGLPPAPPSTPASQMNMLASFDACATPLPIRAEVLNSTELVRKQYLLSEGAETPAPDRGNDTSKQSATHADDFSEWAVGDRYKMMRLLGRGSYGEVAQALDLKAGKSDAFVAIKRIRSAFEQEIDAIRLYREMHILRQMRGHQCIIQLLDVVQPLSDALDDFHDLYLVFEYVDTDLYKLIMSPQYLTTEHIQAFLYQMLVGLMYIHSCSVIHRDMKPANILLNEDCSLKICDFGLARMVNSEQMSSATKQKNRESEKPNLSLFPKLPLTRQLTKHVVTRWYRAPELILVQPYTSAVDIWSVGCILAELLSMQDGNVSGYENRKPLFPGGTCYPLSGDGGPLKKDERIDQLSTIFGVIGTPSEDDLRAIGSASDYVTSLGKMERKPFETMFPAASPHAIDLLKKMLQFNPERRITAKDALEHVFFQGMRQQHLEVEATSEIRGPDFIESDKVDLNHLKQAIYDEARWYAKKGPETQHEKIS